MALKFIKFLTQEWFYIAYKKKYSFFLQLWWSPFYVAADSFLACETWDSDSF